MNELVSIVVPVYNTEEYLDRCINSIISQTYPNLQIILVDDGSADGSGGICDKYAAMDNRIEVVHQGNKGVAAARKVGIAKAGGGYIGFVDSDDYVEPVMFETLVRNMNDTGADFVHSGYLVNGNRVMCFENSVVELPSKKDREKFLRDSVITPSGDKNISPSNWSKLFKKELVKKAVANIPDTQTVGEDVVIFAECIMQSTKISLLNGAYYHYTSRETSLSRSHNMEDAVWQIDLYNILKNILIKYSCYDTEKPFLDRMFKCQVWNIVAYNIKSDFAMLRYCFPDIGMLLHKTVVIYGAGKVGQCYYAQFCRYPEIRIAAWVDKNHDNIDFECFPVSGIEKVSQMDFDYIVIAVRETNQAKLITSELECEGVVSDKIVWRYPIDVCGMEENIK